ncbi:MAG: serine/threonine-protein kinase [Candidatus Eremiobacterota bacterium]
MQRNTLELSAQGEASGGYREVPIGSTPGPLSLAYGELPVTLVFRLPGYKPMARSFPEGALSPAQPHFPGIIPLDPSIPGAPALYWMRDQRWVLAMVPWSLGWWMTRRRADRTAHYLAGMRLRQQKGDFRPGDGVGPYRLLELLGSGAMGKVFLACPRDRPDSRMALKVLHRLHQLEAEVRAVRSITHPNVVYLLDWGECEGHGYLVMEYVEGETLEQHLARNGCLSVTRALEVALQVARALQSAHEKGVVHRDIKPANVMLTVSGPVRVMDFGIASSQQDEATPSMAGTPGYMAVELLMGQACDWRADIYSLGATMYACLSGSAPFVGASPTDTITLQAEGRVAPLGPNVPGDLAELILRYLSTDPTRRAASSAEVVRELEELCEGERVLGVDNSTA